MTNKMCDFHRSTLISHLHLTHKVHIPYERRSLLYQSTADNCSCRKAQFTQFNVLKDFNTKIVIKIISLKNCVNQLELH